MRKTPLTLPETSSRRDRVRAMLADLKMPGPLEAVEEILHDLDGGAITGAEAIEALLGAPIGPYDRRSPRLSPGSPQGMPAGGRLLRKS